MKDEQGFTLVESLIAMMIMVTLLSFAIPLYLTGKAFADVHAKEIKARTLAQMEVERALAHLTVTQQSWKSSPFYYNLEVTQDHLLWHVQVTVQWLDTHHQQRRFKLSTYRYQSKGSPSLK